METSKRKEYLKLVLAFVLGVALTLSFTGAAGTLYMGSIGGSGSSSAVACTLCGIKSDIANMRGGTSATWTLEALMPEIDNKSQWIMRSIQGNDSSGAWSTWTLQGLAEQIDIYGRAVELTVLNNVTGKDADGDYSSWTLQTLAEKIQFACGE